MHQKKHKTLLDREVNRVNQPGFIPNDPVCIPHLFSHQPDVEIMGFLAATLAWGQRQTIIANCHRLIYLFNGEPHSFVLTYRTAQLQRFDGFAHRTFNSTDLLYFMHFLRHFYRKHDSLQQAFTQGVTPESLTVEQGLNNFKKLFFSLPDYPNRTTKHVASPAQKSACKRLNMFLRWMVRTDEAGVDFGLWTAIKPSQLVCPLDVHVSRTARSLGLLTRKQDDWAAALELTANLRKLDPADPVKYDFALFGMGLDGRFHPSQKP